MIPLVSICVPTYNGEAYIAEALESALTQTYSNVELVVSDDNSSDKTLRIVETYRAESKIPIRIYHHEPNGIGANWNNCIKHAKGVYVKFLFQDDVLIPDCIELMVSVLEEHKEVGLVGCKRDFIIEGNLKDTAVQGWLKLYGDLQQHLGNSFNKKSITLTKTIFKHPLFYSKPHNIIGEPSSVLFKKELVSEIGLFDEDLKQVLDYEYWYRILKYYPIVIINKELVRFRLHANQATNVNRENDQTDYGKFERLLYDHYFWLLNRNLKMSLLKKYHIVFRIYKKLMNQLNFIIC